MTEICGKCRTETLKMYSCEHTGDTNVCKECYEQIHWLLTNEQALEKA